MAEKWHSGINMHKLSVGGGFEGLLFTVGCALIFIFGLPALWYFVALAAVVGIGVAVLLRVTSNSRSQRAKPLSILAVPEKTRREPERKSDARDLSRSSLLIAQSS